jgi:hypothetical protein
VAYNAYLAGENLLPNTVTGVGVYLGPVFVRSLKEGTPVLDFVSSTQFTEVQMGRTAHAIAVRHRDAGIIAIPEWSGIDLIPGERSFDPWEKIPPVYETGVMNVMNATLALRGVEEGVSYTRERVVGEVTKFLSVSNNLDVATAIFGAAAQALRDGGSKLAHDHQDRLRNQREPTTQQQKGQLLKEVRGLLIDPVSEAGERFDIPGENLAGFILNLTNPDVLEAA